MKAPLKVGQVVRWVSDGEDQNGKVLYWTRLRGTVTDIWPTDEQHAGGWKISVRWRQPAPHRYTVGVPISEVTTAK